MAMTLKLTRLPHGTNRNRTLRRQTDFQDEEIDLAELGRLFSRFWRRWQTAGRNDSREVEA